MRVAVCGGHLTPALAVMEELKEHDSYVSFIFFGRKNYLEYETLKGWPEIIFINQISGRIQRFWTISNLLTLFKVLVGFGQSIFFLIKNKTDVVVSFGGYISVPVVLAGWLLRIPVLSHEQTTTIGLASRVNSHFSDVICLSWPESQKYFPPKKSVITGNPLRKSILMPNLKSSYMSLLKQHLPIIFITGGNQGSQIINETIKKILPQLLNSYVVIHQYGNLTDFNIIPSDRYIPKKHIDPEDIGAIYKISSLVISRSGANTVTELLYYKKKAVLIPLPFSQNQEQLKNAQMLSSVGLAKILEQKILSPASLNQAIKDMINKKVTQLPDQKNNAAYLIYEYIKQLYEKKKNNN